MSTKDGSSGTNENAGGELDNQEKLPETVRYETHRKLLGEKKDMQDKLRAKEQEVERLLNEQKERERKELEAQGNYKKLLEQREQELQKERDEKNAILTEFQNARKIRAVLKNISGVVPEKLVQMLPIDKVIIGDDGKPDELSAKLAAQDFESEFSFAIQRDKLNGGLPNDAPKGGTTTLPTYEEWNLLPAKEQRKLLPEMLRAGRLK